MGIYELMSVPLPWVLFYTPLMWNVCAMQDMYHESTDNTDKISSNFPKKILNFPKIKYIEGQFQY